jgi:hypothetical protein
MTNRMVYRLLAGAASALLLGAAVSAQAATSAPGGVTVDTQRARASTSTASAATARA